MTIMIKGRSYLLDTMAILWYAFLPRRLPRAAREVILNEEIHLVFSTVSSGSAFSPPGPFRPNAGRPIHDRGVINPQFGYDIRTIWSQTGLVINPYKAA